MNDLFENDPAFVVVLKQTSNKHRLRDAQGRFATERESRASKALAENERLKRDVEKYRRMYVSAGDLASFWHRKYLALEESVKSKQHDTRNKRSSQNA